MPRKSLDELEATPAPAEKEKKADATVVSTEDKTTRKVKLDLEVDTSVKDLGPNPMQTYTHGKSSRQLENFSKIIFNCLHYTL